MPDRELAKRAAGERAASLVEDGMCIGLGTGSTTAYALQALARRIREEGLSLVGTPTSTSAERMARACGIEMVTLDAVDRIDLALDGADEVDPDLNLIKGRGAAHTREKVVAAMADRFVVLADASKLVDRLGSRAPVPVEVLPMAVHPVELALARLGGEPVLRIGARKDGPLVTDQGFWILDVTFARIDDAGEMDRAIKGLPGVLDHGIFVGLATDVFVGQNDGDVRVLALDGAR
jgi:ribose 5-phosphate isomerase A